MHPIAAVCIPGSTRHSVVEPPSRQPFDAFFSASHEFQRQGSAAIPAKRMSCDDSVQSLETRIEHRGGGAGFERLERLVALGVLASADVACTSHRESHGFRGVAQLAGLDSEVSRNSIAAVCIPKRRHLVALPLFQQFFDARPCPLHRRAPRWKH